MCATRMIVKKNRKGISTFIATLLLMVLAVSAGVVIYAYTMGYLGGFGGPQTMGAISLDTYNFVDATHLQVYVRNIGKSTFELQSVYIDGVSVPTGDFDHITIDENGVRDTRITYAAGFGTTTHVVKLIGVDNTQISFNAKRTASSGVVTYSLTINTVGSGSVAKSPNQSSYSLGASVQLTATPLAGWVFSSWSGDLTGSTNPGTVIIDTDPSVTATFVLGMASPTLSTTPPSGAVVGVGFTDSATLTGATSNAGGTVTYTLYSGTYPSGTPVGTPSTVTVTNAAVPNSASFTVASAGPYYFTASYSGDANNNPVPVGTYHEDFTVNLSTVTITITSSTTGSNFVEVDDLAYSTPHDFVWSVGSTYKLEALSPVSGGAGIQYVYSSWSDSGDQVHDYIVPGSSTTVTANYDTQYQLTMATNAGTTSPAVGTSWQTAGASVPISATPPSVGAGEQYVWVGWTGSGTGSYTGSTASPSITMNGPISETAAWTHQYQLTVTASPSGAVGGTFRVTYTQGGTVHTTEQHTTTWSGWTDAGTTATVSSPQSPYNSLTFSSYNPSASVTMNAANTITLVYTGTFGYTTQGSSSSNGNLENYILGSIYTTPGYDVTAQSITAYIQVGGTHTIKAAIYTSTGSLVAQTSAVSVTTSSDGWVMFAFASGVQLTANTNYLLVVWSDSGNNEANMYYTSSGGSGRWYSIDYSDNSGNFPASVTFNTSTVGSYRYSIYCTFS